MAKNFQSSKLNSNTLHSGMFTVSCPQRHCRRPQRRKSGQKLSCHKFNVTRSEREREVATWACKKYSTPVVDITKKKPRCAKNRGNGDDARWHPPRQINVSNSNTFHIPTSNCLLQFYVSLMGSHQFGEGLQMPVCPERLYGRYASQQDDTYSITQ